MVALPIPAVSRTSSSLTDDLLPKEIHDELLALDSYLSGVRRQTLPELLRAWARYSQMVHKGPVSLDDYVGMLFAHDAIQDVMNRASPTTNRVVEALISEGDSVFYFAGARPDKDGRVQQVTTDGRSAWWWKTRPGMARGGPRKAP